METKLGGGAESQKGIVDQDRKLSNLGSGVRCGRERVQKTVRICTQEGAHAVWLKNTSTGNQHRPRVKKGHT